MEVIIPETNDISDDIRRDDLLHRCTDATHASLSYCGSTKGAYT